MDRLAEVFAHPPANYRGAPFWSWNDTLDPSLLMRQFEFLRQMGFGGFHIHSRTGLASEYLGQTFMQCVRLCVDRAAETGMLCWLYDEDRWPSGFAGGLVTRTPEHRAKHLLFTRQPYRSAADGLQALGQGRGITSASTGSTPSARQENGHLLAAYEVTLRNGYLDQYRRLNAPSDAWRADNVWYAYLETSVQSSWFNNQAYADTLQAQTTRRFIQTTHERYREVVGMHFGSIIPAIFTDEPQFSRKQYLKTPDDASDVCVPFTTDFFESYFRAFGQRLEDFLPELFWELPDGRASVARYRYHDHLTERFASAYADTLGQWCESNRIALTGHMMEEPDLGCQTDAVGEVMRSLRSFHIPGIDILCDLREYNTAKQAQSVARQFGRAGVMSELYGVTNWDFDFAGYKSQGDWQAALGVTLRVPHLAWMSMAGEAKRDYPASIFYQSPWFTQYPLIEDHFARINTLMTRGQPIARIAVIHPIESYWLCAGCLSQTQQQRALREQRFDDLTDWLLFDLLDFDFISEALLPALPGGTDGVRLRVGKMAYDVVIVPSLRTIRSSTLEALEALADAGGQVVFAGEIPSLVDALPSHRPAALAARCVAVPFAKDAILGTLDRFREIDVRSDDGALDDSLPLLHQLRAEEDQRYLFICNASRTRAAENLKLDVRGQWSIERWDTLSADRSAVPAEPSGQAGWTTIALDLPAHGSALFRLHPPPPQIQLTATPPVRWKEHSLVEGPLEIELSEPNALLLDQAQWRLGGESDWRPREEILRIDDAMRKRLNLAPRMGAIAQPWTDRSDAPVLDTLELRFELDCRIGALAPRLACEALWAGASVSIDQRPAPVRIDGWYVDESIPTAVLPDLDQGVHELIITIPYSRKTHVEWCYILGSFGVEVRGPQARIVAPPSKLAFGDWCPQGLPFYTGNVTYIADIVVGAAHELALRVPDFRSPVLSVALDGRHVGPIAFSPFRAGLGRLEPGKHRLAITAFGHRFNGFGSLHNANPNTVWFGPDCWRTRGQHWTYDYQLKPMGILSPPILEKA